MAHSFPFQLLVQRPELLCSAVAALKLDEVAGPVLSPALDPLAPIPGGPRGADRAIDRPKSAAGAVGRPRSTLPGSDGLPNGARSSQSRTADL